jgi:MoxR-like ATPase
MAAGTEAKLKRAYEEISGLLRRDVVGMEEVIRLLLACVFSGGHCLLIGVPGLAKTLLVSSLAKLIDLKFSRIQFTPDLMPSDITGAEIIVEDKETGHREFEFKHGPMFAHVVLADEINRTPPKTQAALIEAMEEGHVSSLGKRIELERPFFVLATQNPIEQEGTYQLPAAQLDRFLFNIAVDYPAKEDEVEIARLATRRAADARIAPVLSRADVLEVIAAVRSAAAPQDVVEYATTIVRRSRPGDAAAPEVVKRYVTYGAGPRAAQGLVLGAKALALMRGDTQPTLADVRALVHPVLRHRIVLNFVSAADAMTADRIIDDLVRSVPAADLPAAEPARPSLWRRLFAERGAAG